MIMKLMTLKSKYYVTLSNGYMEHGTFQILNLLYDLYYLCLFNIQYNIVLIPLEALTFI